MSYNGSGVFSITSTGQPVVANTLITAAVFNAFAADIATGLSTALCKDGQQTVTANLPMGGFRFTGLGAGAGTGQSLRYEQLFTTSAVTLMGAIDQVKGADIASAATVNLTTATGNGVHITGTTQITAVTLGSGMWRVVVFDGALTLTHHATNNNLPGAANITTAAGDRALYWADGTTVYCMAYQKANGKAVVETAPAVGSITGLGTGVATALAVNVGSAGAVTLSPSTRQVFTANGTWTKPSNLRAVLVEVIGGGGSAAGIPATGAGQMSVSGGAGGGGYSSKYIAVGSLGATETVTVGAGGTAATANGAGNAGGTSSFGSHCSATGGAASSAAGPTTSQDTTGVPGAGGTASGGDINIQGGSGGWGQISNEVDSATGGKGGDSRYGFGGISPRSNSAGNAGQVYGGGSSGAASGASQADRAGTAGAAGIIIVTELY